MNHPRGLLFEYDREAEAVERAAQHKRAVVLLDEIQHIARWAGRLKGEWDRLRRKKLPVHVVATGSSALALGSGSNETLAGRFERLTLVHWSAAALEQAFGRGLLEFTRRWPRFRPLVVCDEAQLSTAQRLGLAAISWERFLLSGPPRT